MIENMSRATFERSAYFEWVSSCRRHHPVMSGIQNVLVISIGSEWKSLRFGLIWTQFFGDASSEYKSSLAAVKQCAARSLHPGVVLATLVGFKYFSSSLDKSSG